MRWTSCFVFVSCVLAACSSDKPVLGEDGGIPDGAESMCTEPGALETVACGTCGTTERFCTVDGTWAYGACEGESGTCVPGTTQEIACGACGTQMARCTSACEWEAIGECSDGAGCEPGTRSRSSEGCAAGEDREVVCGESCAFEPVGECQPNECDEPGAFETISCGACGLQERFCTAAGVWEYTVCEEDGVCVPGTTETVECGECGMQSRRCTTECRWDAGACIEDDECMPDECVPACTGGATCVDGVCVSGDCPEAELYGCGLVPQCGCSGSRMCTVDRTARERVCITAGSGREGDACDSYGCRAGLACFGGVCRRWCNGDADCGGGTCSLERLDIDGAPLPFPADLCTIACDPLGSDCGDGACSISGSGDDATTDCRSVTELPIPFGCIINENCPAGTACVGMACQPYCRVGVTGDCSGTCTPLTGSPRWEGRVWGTCS